jgi:DNA mismatch repair ATPase MutL
LLTYFIGLLLNILQAAQPTGAASSMAGMQSQINTLTQTLQEEVEQRQWQVEGLHKVVTTMHGAAPLDITCMPILLNMRQLQSSIVILQRVLKEEMQKTQAAAVEIAQLKLQMEGMAQLQVRVQVLEANVATRDGEIARLKEQLAALPQPAQQPNKRTKRHG